MSTKRITPEEVLAAYKKTGLTPTQGIYLDLKENCGCPIGAYVLAYLTPENKKDDPGCVETVMEHEGFSDFYTGGFVRGFDGDRFGSYQPDAVLGYKDGKVVREAVKKLVEQG